MRTEQRVKRRWVASLALLPLITLSAACGTSDDSGGDSLVLYSGRDEKLVQPLIDDFEADTGITVDVRYGNSAEMGAQILEEGSSTPAEVFYSQEVGAVGVLEKAGMLAELPQDVVDRVPARFRPKANNQWVGVTGRSRVIVYNPDLVDDVPAGVLDLTDPKYAGKLAWAPANASFQSFVTAFRVSAGEDETRTWLEGMLANDPVSYESNTEILDAVNNGDIGIGLINHYYWARALSELGDDMKAEIVFPKGDDPGGLVNATAVAVLNDAAEDPDARALVEYLLSEEGQTHFVDETKEYPLVEGIAQPDGVPPLSDLEGPDVDLTDLESLEQTQSLLVELGILD